MNALSSTKRRGESGNEARLRAQMFPTMWPPLSTVRIDVLAMFAFTYCIGDVCNPLIFIFCTGLDWGGVSRECFELLSVECFDASKGLFKRFKDNPQALVSLALHMKTFELSDTLHLYMHVHTYTQCKVLSVLLPLPPVPIFSSLSLLPQVHPNHQRSPQWKMKHFEFSGRLVGKCLYESAMGNPMLIKARFTRSFLAQLIGLRINHKVQSLHMPCYLHVFVVVVVVVVAVVVLIQS